MKKAVLIFTLWLVWWGGNTAQAQTQPATQPKPAVAKAPAQPKNIALHEAVTGPFTDAVKVTDGIIDKKNFAVPQPTTQPKLELMLNLRGQAYVDRVVIYGNAALKNCHFEVKGSLDIFTWEPFNAGTFAEYKDGIVQYELSGKPQMVQYVMVSFDTGAGVKDLKIHEVELFSQEVTDIKFTELHVENVTETAADICWKTDVATTSKVRYSNRPEKLDKVVTQINLGTDHRLAITGLLKGTDYYYDVTVDDLRLQPFSSAQQTFRTAGIPLPLYTGYKIIPDKDKVVITWRTNVGTKGILEFGDSTALKYKYTLKDTLATDRGVEVSNLFPSTDYQFKVLAIDSFNNRIASEVKRFTTNEWNVALNKPVVGTFTERPDNYISQDKPILNRVNDGSTNYFTGMATSGSVALDSQYVRIDLEQVYEVDNIWVMWRALAMSRDFSISGSLDDKAYFPLAEHIDPMTVGAKSSSESGDPAYVDIIPAKGQKIRYVKLLVPKGGAFYNKHAGRLNFVQLMELKVFPVIKKEFKPTVKEIFKPQESAK